MRADRRHELKENDLAHALELAREYLDRNGKRLGIVVLAVLAVAVTVTLTMRTRAASLEDAWKQKVALTYENVEDGKQSLDKLSALLRDSSDPSFVMSALIDQGLQSLRLAQEVPLPPDGNLNDRAKSAFDQLLARFGHNPIAQGTARLGLATVAENEFAIDGSIAHKETARDQLTAVVEHPALATLPYHLLARERLEQLDDTFTVVRFSAAPPPEPEPPAEPVVQPTTITPTPISPDELPADLRRLQRVRVNEDGTIEPVDDENSDDGVDEAQP